MFAFFAIALVVSFCTINHALFISNSRVGHSLTRRFLFGNPEPPKSANTNKDAGGLFGGMNNMMENMKKAQELAKSMEQLNKELMDTLIVGQDPNGQVTATFNGLSQPVSIKFSDAIVAQGSEAVSLAGTQALVDVYAKCQQAMVQKMAAKYGNMGK